MSAVEQYAPAQPVYMNDAYIPLVENRSRYVVLRGGGGSGKSVWAAQKMAIRLTSERNHRLLVVRKVQRTLQQSVYQQLLDVLRGWDMGHRITATVSPLSIKCADTGSEILFAGIDDPEKIKSITRITSIWVEEATELSLEDFTQLDIRLRGAVNYYKQFMITFNPVDEKHWLKKRFFDTPDPRATTLLTTFQDNYFLPQEDRETLFSLAAVSPNYHRIYVQNEWGRVETGNEWLHQFSVAKHVGKVAYAEGVNIFQSWDANSLPYCAMFCAQAVDNRARGGKLQLRVFQEYALRSPNSGITSTGHRFLLDREARGWKSSAVFLTGDASLRARKTGEEKQTNFLDVQAALNGYRNDDGAHVPGCLNGGSADFWPRSNPGVMRRRDFVNYLLAGKLADVELLIDEGCAELIEDATLTQLGVDGKLKELYEDKQLGVRYQKRGHMTDILEYYLCTVLAGQYAAFEATRGA